MTDDIYFLAKNSAEAPLSLDMGMKAEPPAGGLSDVVSDKQNGKLNLKRET